MVIIAVSGGPDSVALLRGLLAVRERAVGLASNGGSGGEEREEWRIVAAHLNHGLRGTNSERDEQFVRELCMRIGVTLEVGRCDIAAEAAAQRTGIEATARKRRYEFLGRVADQYGAHLVAVGHTADDQVETILHRLLRGTGLAGLAGMPARRRLSPQCELIRPLLEFSRQEILAYLEGLGEPFVTDETNQQLHATRNRIRHDLLPKLQREFNPQVRQALLRLAKQAAQASQIVEAEAERLLRAALRSSGRGSHGMPAAAGQCGGEGPQRVWLDITAMAGKPRHLIRGCLLQLWRRQGWPLGQMTYDHWDRLAKLVQTSKAHSDGADGAAAITLPGAIDARRRGAQLVITRLNLHSNASSAELTGDR